MQQAADLWNSFLENAVGSRSLDRFRWKRCFFLYLIYLCLYKHFNADQECIFEVNPRSSPLNMPHLTSQNGLILHKLDSFPYKLNQTC